MITTEVIAGGIVLPSIEGGWVFIRNDGPRAVEVVGVGLLPPGWGLQVRNEDGRWRPIPTRRERLAAIGVHEIYEHQP